MRGRLLAIWLGCFGAVVPGSALGSAVESPPRATEVRPGSERAQDCARNRPEPCPVDGGQRFRMLSAGATHTCGLTNAGAVLCWGDGRTGALGDGARVIRRTPVPARSTVRFDEVRAGDGYTCARTAPGAVYCWGTGHAVPGHPAPALRPVAVALAEPARALAVGRRHACVITQREAVLCWGRNIDGETGNGTSGVDASLTPVPTPVAGDLRARAITAGLDFTCALGSDGAPWCWGSNVDRVLLDDAPMRCGDVNPLPCSPVPRRVAAGHAFVDIAAGTGHVCARTAGGEVHCWGADSAGQLGPGAGPPPKRVSAGTTGRFAALASGGVQTCALVEPGMVYCWGRDRLASADLPAPAEGVRRLAVPRATAVTVGGNHACAIATSGAAFCWGDSALGALGRR